MAPVEDRVQFEFRESTVEQRMRINFGDRMSRLVHSAESPVRRFFSYSVSARQGRLFDEPDREHAGASWHYMRYLDPHKHWSRGGVERLARGNLERAGRSRGFFFIPVMTALGSTERRSYRVAGLDPVQQVLPQLSRYQAPHQHAGRASQISPGYREYIVLMDAAGQAVFGQEVRWDAVAARRPLDPRANVWNPHAFLERWTGELGRDAAPIQLIREAAHGTGGRTTDPDDEVPEDEIIIDDPERRRQLRLELAAASLDDSALDWETLSRIDEEAWGIPEDSE